MNDLAGCLHIQPGAAVPHNLHSSRRAWASRLAPGRPADALPGLLGGLFGLCGQAHRSASQLAIQVVEPSLFPSVGVVAANLQRETVFEHVRRIALDWPRLLADPLSAQEVALSAADSLRSCPLLATPSDADAWLRLRQWLQQEWLNMCPNLWLQAWQQDQLDWLNEWALRHQGWLPSLLQTASKLDMDLPQTREQTLRPHENEQGLHSLAAELHRCESFAMRPTWQGRVVCTGNWSRLHQSVALQRGTAVSLLGSRLAELVRLCLPDAPAQAGSAWLAWGSLSTGPRQGLAWVEMARGLLIHQVTLDNTSPSGVPMVQACQVLAPTEWNFHPEGVAAQALARVPMDAPDWRARVNLLMAALDPCVPFEIREFSTSNKGMERAHA